MRWAAHPGGGKCQLPTRDVGEEGEEEEREDEVLLPGHHCKGMIHNELFLASIQSGIHRCVIGLQTATHNLSSLILKKIILPHFFSCL
mgnify:CR=1 FL=1